jgi:hypothetical protein
MKEKGEVAVPKECRKCTSWKKIKEKIRVSELLSKAIAAFETRIKEKDFKPTIAEYLKLVQMEQELEQDEAKEIKVTWIDPLAKSDSEK